MDHAEEVLQRVFPPYSEAAEVLEPGKESLDLPPPSIAAERATVLCPLFPRSAVRSDQLNATACQFRIQSVRLVGVVADEMHWELLDKPLSKSRFHQF